MKVEVHVPHSASFHSQCEGNPSAWIGGGTLITVEIKVSSPYLASSDITT
jgi:hypothetical protein